MWAENLIITLEKEPTGSLKPRHRRIFEQVRDAILDGRLRPGDRLPATRQLAAALGLARNTVARAYEDLLTQGYLVGRVGAGTFISSELKPPPERHGPREGRRTGQEARNRAGAIAVSRKPAISSSSSISSIASVAPALEWPGSVPATQQIRFDFRPGIPDWDAFPRALWLRLIGRALRRNAAELGRYGEPAGYFPLRQAIARSLAVSRAVAALPEQVVIVSGSQQAFDLIARLCIRPGDTAAVEDPGYPEARLVLAAAASRLLPIPVDGEGIDVSRLERVSRTRRASRPVSRALHGPRLVYLTPSHQFPTGATLSLARRLALMDWAARSRAFIVEDDYDSEFRDPARMVESLQGLDRAEKVLYIGTFSTVLFPPLRVGYVVLPQGLVEPFVRIKMLADRHTPILEQLALTDFLEEGHFERHLRRMRRLAAIRRDALRAAVDACFGGTVELSSENAGMHLLMRFLAVGGRRDRGWNPAQMEKMIVELAAARGVGVYPVGPCHSRPPKYAAVLLGYASMPEDRIHEGMRILAGTVASA